MPQNNTKKFTGLLSIAILRKSSSYMMSYQDMRLLRLRFIKIR